MKRLSLLPLLLFFFFPLASCLPVYTMQDVNSKQFPFVRASFLKFEQYAYDPACSPKKDPSCMKDVLLSTGSATVILDGKHVLTAGHVCEVKPSIQETAKRLGHKIKNVIIDQKGIRYKVTPVYEDKMNDICILKSKTLKKKPIKLSLKEPNIRDKVYSLGFPRGRFVMVEGFHSAIEKVAFRNNILSLNSFSIPAAPGSSGSAILNFRGEIVGLISLKVGGFENLVFSPKYIHLKKSFIKAHTIALK